MGCLTRIGCAVVLVVGGAAGYWLYGDRFPAVLSRAASGAADKVTDVAVRTSERLDSQEGARIAAEEAARRQADRAARDSALGWVTLSTSAAPKARTPNPLAPLRRRNGPAYVSLTASQVAALLAPLLQQLPPSAGSADVAFDRDHLLLRANVAWQDFTGESAFGSVLGKTLLGQDTLFLAGPVEPVRPGLAQLRVRELRIKGVEVPSRAIPSLIAALRRHAAVAPADSAFTGLAVDALPFPLPTAASDARVVNGKLTLYRAVPATSTTPAK